jgi:hypothetical protein
MICWPVSARVGNVKNNDPSLVELGEQFLHVSVAQGEAEIKPDRVLNDLGRKAMALTCPFALAGSRFPVTRPSYTCPVLA